MQLLKSFSPANGSLVGSVKISTKADLEQALIEARKAQPGWRGAGLAKRAKITDKAGQLLRQNISKLAVLMAKEMGKPLVEAEGEIGLSADYLKYYSQEAFKVFQDELLKKNGKSASILRYDPLGVVALIKPWNFPVLVPVWTLAPALLAGNSVIFKPSESVPLTSQFLVNLFYQAGIPKNVLYVLFGRAQLGQMLVDGPIDMVSFTGSNLVGTEVGQKCAPRLVKCLLELGGSSAAIVARDADLELAANAIVYGRFSNCGQDCVAIKRVFAERAVYNKLLKLLLTKIKALKVGDPLDKNTDLGPLVSEAQLKRFEAQVTKGVVQGGRIIAGGRRLRTEPYTRGWFHEPTLMIHVHSKMAVMQEEVFGPLLPVAEAESFSQAVRLANGTQFGLSAAVFTSSKANISQAQKELEAGTVYVNDTAVFYPNVPYQPVKMSGIGVESGRFGLLEFVHKKHLHTNLAGAKTRNYWFPYGGKS